MKKQRLFLVLIALAVLALSSLACSDSVEDVSDGLEQLEGCFDGEACLPDSPSDTPGIVGPPPDLGGPVPAPVAP